MKRFKKKRFRNFTGRSAVTLRLGGAGAAQGGFVNQEEFVNQLGRPTALVWQRPSPSLRLDPPQGRVSQKQRPPLIPTSCLIPTPCRTLEPVPEPMSRTALAAVKFRKTVASAKTAHLKSRYWDRFSSSLCIVFCLALTILLTAGGMQQSTIAQETPAATDTWSTSLKDAAKKSAISGKPVLVKFEADWCGPCKKLNEEFKKPAFEEISKSVILVRIDIDRQSDVADDYDITSIPHVMLIDGNEEIVAEKIGFAEVDKWVSWTKESIKGTEFEMPDVLQSTDPPTRTEIVELIETLGSRDPALRQITMERLVAFPSKTRGQLIESLGEKGKLARKISAIEILQRWQAPVDGLDPWTKTSFTPERLKLLDQWNQTPIEELEQSLAELKQSDLESAKEEIAQLLQSNNPRANLARLTRYGSGLLPTVYEKIKLANTDEEKFRLTSLRYWLTASNELRLGWASGLIQLASPDLDSRRSAVQGLINRATLPDQALLLELFADSDPLVRELSLKGLQQIGAKETNETMARLLNDPEANVRAAVLKQFAESENRSAKTINVVAKYLETETDADLIVHALRFLRESSSDEAVKAVLRFTDHESWQVRAEVAEALGEIDADDLSLDMVVLRGEAVTKLLDDPDGFVVSRAIQSLPSRKNKKLLEDLTNIAIRKPELASDIAASISESANRYSYDDDAASAAPFFRKFLENEEAEIRLAGVDGITQNYAKTWTDPELSKLLKDSDSDVRIASMKAFLKRLESYRTFTEDVGSRAQAQSITPRRSSGGLLGMFFGGSGRSRSSKTIPAAPAASQEEIEAKIAEAIKAQEPGDAETEDSEPSSTTELIETTEPTEAAEAKPTADAQEDTDSQDEADTESQPTQEPADPTAQTEESKAESESKEEAKEPKKEEPKLPKLVGEQWLEQWIAGEIEIEFDDSVAEIEKLAKSKYLRERKMAFACQVALGDHAEAFDKFMAESDSFTEEDFRLLFELLTWLPPEKRTSVFLKTAKKASAEGKQYLLNQYAAVRNPDGAKAIWEVAEDDNFELSNLYHSLLSVYFSNAVSYYSEMDPGDVHTDLIEFVKKQSQPYALSDHPTQQKLALLVVHKIDLAAGKEMAKRLLESGADWKVKDLAFRVSLVPAKSKKQDRYGNSVNSDDRSHAVEYLKTDDAGRFKTTLKYLALGNDVLNADDGIYLVENSYSYSYGNSDVKVRIPKAPKGMTLEHLDNKEFEANDEEVLALSTYFKSLLDPKTDLKPLIDYWENEDSSEEMATMVYEAIAATNNDKLTPSIEAIFEAHGEDSDRYAADLYWTIRVMTGKKALALRKRIRDKVGMSTLKNY